MAWYSFSIVCRIDSECHTVRADMTKQKDGKIGYFRGIGGGGEVYYLIQPEGLKWALQV